MGLLAEELLDDFLHLGHARHAAYEHHFIDLDGREASVLQRLATRIQCALNQIVDERLVFRARQLEREVLRPRGVGGDIRQVDVCLRRG